MTSFCLTITLTSPAQTHDLGCKMAQFLQPGDTLLLHGEIGAGKTVLVKGLGQGLGITEAIVSPTFALIHEYLHGNIPLYHLDLYRLETSAEVRAIAPEIYWEGQEVEPGITVIEWAERLPEFPSHYWQLSLETTVATQRQAHLQLINPTDASQSQWNQLQQELLVLSS